MLTREQVAHFHNRGFVRVEGLIDPQACDGLRARADALIAGFAAGEARDSCTVFSTHSHQHDKDRYFLSSDQNVSFFFEEEAFASSGEEGETAVGKLRVPLTQAINKIGHALHTQDAVFRAFIEQPHLVEAVRDLGYLDEAEVIQSMYIFKQPFIGGEVTCHQDSTFIHTAPDRVLGVWFALEDAHRDNGCLWGLPGAHADLPPAQLFVRGEGRCSFVPPQSARRWDLEGLEALEAKKGTVIFFHGRFPHMSYANRSAASRHAFTLHLVSPKDEYLTSNWIRKSERNTLRLF